MPSVGRGDSAASWESHTDLARGVPARDRRVARVASDDTRGLRHVRRRQRRTGLGLDTRLVQLISADGARICAMRVARRLSAGRARCAAACVQWAREHGGRWRPAGPGAPVQMSQDQNVTAFLCSERHTLRRQAAGRAAATTTGSQRGTGGRCERRTISSRRSGAPPCCPSPRPSPHRPPFLGGNCHDARRQRQARCESGQGPGLSAPARQLCERCAGMARDQGLAGLAVHAPSRRLAAHAASTRLRCVALVMTLATPCTRPTQVLRARSAGDDRDGRTAIDAAHTGVCGARVSCPPPTRNA